MIVNILLSIVALLEGILLVHDLMKKGGDEK